MKTVSFSITFDGSRLIWWLLLLCPLMTGCAGLDVTYDFHATYISEELIAKRQADVDRLREQKRLDDIARAQLP